jgi:hypothetical protein
MKLTIVAAYGTPGLIPLPELEGKTGKSYDAIARLLKEGQHATVEVPGKGYKDVSIRDGVVYLQRNFSPEY